MTMIEQQDAAKRLDIPYRKSVTSSLLDVSHRIRPCGVLPVTTLSRGTAVSRVLPQWRSRGTHVAVTSLVSSNISMVSLRKLVRSPG